MRMCQNAGPFIIAWVCSFNMVMWICPFWLILLSCGSAVLVAIRVSFLFAEILAWHDWWDLTFLRGAGASSRPSPYDENPKGKGKSKGKGKRKTKGEHVQTWVPPKLRGGRPTNPAGSPSCFNYNLEGCDGAQPGSASPRGLHICCKCFKAHPFTGNHDPESKPRKPWLSRLCALEHKSLHEAFVIEIFAGTGGITAWLRKVRMTSSFDIDCVAEIRVLFPLAKSEHDVMFEIWLSC